jgi:beta-xylosidase
MPALPFKKFDEVKSGEGVWAPSIRFHGGKYYCVIPFPDEGIFVCETTDPAGEWSKPRQLIDGKGIIDPCPIWVDGKCYLAVAFAKSRAGFNSIIAVYEVDENLTKVLSDGYTVVYDGHDNNPTIEGPKFYRHGDYFYILAPAGSVKSGWQVALRSKDIYGPYESKIILMQGDTLINGPHQGALVDVGDDRWAFVHFQDMRAFGRVVHLQPAVWVNDWVLCGNVNDYNLAGTPVSGGDYPVDIRTNFSLQISDYFTSDKLSLMWQTPANLQEGWYSLSDRLKLNCVKSPQSLNLTGQIFTTKITAKKFTVKAKAAINFCNDGDEVGLCMTGESYAYICVRRENGKNFLTLVEGKDGREVTLFRKRFFGNAITFSLSASDANIYDLLYTFTCDKAVKGFTFKASAGKWTGAKIGIYARNTLTDSPSFATFKYFIMK